MPIDSPVSWHPRKWTLGEVLVLPEDDVQRIELVDGTLVMSPAPGFRHQRLQQAIQLALHPALPPGLELLPASMWSCRSSGCSSPT